MINWRNNNKWESVEMNKEFYSSCVAKWDDENVLITGGKKTAHGVSNINIKRISLSAIKCFFILNHFNILHSQSLQQVILGS